MQLPCDVALLAAFLSYVLGSVSASVGDRSWVFGRCMDTCLHQKCTDMTRFKSKQPWIRQVLRWSCTDECRYTCMWKTVRAFEKDGSPIPQFFGKVSRVLAQQDWAVVMLKWSLWVEVLLYQLLRHIKVSLLVRHLRAIFIHLLTYISLCIDFYLWD